MGLDMYLNAKKYIGGWEHSTPEEQAQFKKLLEGSGLPEGLVARGSPHGHSEWCIGYWRKANAIHQWFVQNVQNGEDNCGDYYVDDDDLQKLLDCCKAIIEAPESARSVMPTQSGFFFGGTKYDEWYWDNIRETIALIEGIQKAQNTGSMEGWAIYYHSSW